MSMRRRKAELEPRLRFPAPNHRAFGPGKADLLRHIADTGSITRAAFRMKMSYNRAWILVRDMNRLFSEPLVAAERGGKSGGGASLTSTGKEVIARYSRMETACRKATRHEWSILRRKLRP